MQPPGVNKIVTETSAAAPKKVATYEAQSPQTGAHLDAALAREKDIGTSNLGTTFAGQKEAQLEALARSGQAGSGAGQQQMNRLGESQALAQGRMVGEMEKDFARQKTQANQFDVNQQLGEKGFQLSAELGRGNLGLQQQGQQAGQEQWRADFGLRQQGQTAGQEQWKAQFQQQQADALNAQRMQMEQMKMQQQQALLAAQRSSPNYGTNVTGGYFGQPKQPSGAPAQYPTGNTGTTLGSPRTPTASGGGLFASRPGTTTGGAGWR